VTGRDDEAPLRDRAVAAAIAELRGERTKILGATGQTSLQSLIRARRVPDRWSVPHVMDRLEEGFRTLSRLPLQSSPNAGDAFTVYQGCDHTPGTCQSKFNNLANFRGFPYVPPPQMAI
jgi:Phage conserved hypothetical protein BR0599